MPIDVDVIILTRDMSPLRPEVRHALESQGEVAVRLHRVIGTPRAADAHRWQTIARARNEGKHRGTSPWVMFVDDDVVLGTGCIAQLVRALQARPEFAALAADYNGDMRSGRANWDYPRHVGMGATLFRRERLATIAFRWEADKCECQCCCDDLRRVGFGIGYLPGAAAAHRPSASRSASPAARSETTAPSIPHQAGQILAAFDRRHLRKFQCQFLRTLRDAGNHELVSAIAYGLRPDEIRALARTPNVEVIAASSNAMHPSYRRVYDFQRVLAGFDGRTPVATWDAGDVLFQGRIDGVWDLVRAHPDELLIVEEAFSHPENPAVVDWTAQITGSTARRQAFDLLSTRTFLNSGFIAGTAQTLLHYFGEAERLLGSQGLLSIGYGADQIAMNLYCHTNLGRWRTVSERWNYCLCGRSRQAYRMNIFGRVRRVDDQPVDVVHGNGGTLRDVAWYYRSRPLTMS
jgi:hypothetical protein